MIVLGGEISSNYKDNHKPNSKHKDDIINAVKLWPGNLLRRKSQQEPKRLMGKWIPLTKDTGLPH
jgi:hypothetical protein